MTDLKNAYALNAPADSKRLYADWAGTYDEGFAQAMDYRLARLVAFIYAEVGAGASPLLDVGAGTGLVAQNIPIKSGIEMDALDLSAEMLEAAARKGLYRKLVEADLTRPLPLADNTYGAIVSAGTFTHGHVGPEPLDELLRVARKGAVFVLAINDQHFEGHGFAAKFDALAPRIDDAEFRKVRIYGEAPTGDHKDDEAQIAVFRKV